MSSKAKSGAKRKEDSAATDTKRVRSEEEAVGAVLDLAVERDGPTSTARSVVKPALEGIIAFDGKTWRCQLCSVGRGTNDGGTGATNGLLHAIKDHLSATPQAALVAYVKASKGKIEKAVKRLNDGEIAELCAAKPAAAASMDSEYFRCTSDRERKECLARALGEGLGASNYPLSVGNSDLVGRIFHVFDPHAPRPSRPFVTKHTDLAAINAIVDVHKELISLREFLGSKALAAGALCVAADMWSADKSVECPGFLCQRVHYVHPDTFEQTTHPLGFTFVPDAHTGVNMYNAFHAALKNPLAALDDIKELAKGAKLTGSIADEQVSCTITDGAANIKRMVVLFRENENERIMPARRQCAVHLAETATQDALKDPAMPERVIKVLNTAKKLPVFFRKAPARMRLMRKAAAGLKVWAMGIICKTRFYTRAVQGAKVLHNAPAIILIDSKAMQFTGKNKAKNEAEFSEHKARLATAITPTPGGSSFLADVLGVLNTVMNFEIFFSGARYQTLSHLPNALDVMTTKLKMIENSAGAEVARMAQLVASHVNSRFNAQADMPHAWAASLLNPEVFLTIAMPRRRRQSSART